MSKLASTRSTGKSLCYPSQKEIQDWSSEGKRKASIFVKRNNQTINYRTHSKLTIDNQEDMQYAFNSSLNQLRQKTRTQKSNSSSLSNRMSYLDVELRRKNQMKELAKSKYHKMIEVRQKSFVQKRQLKKERENLIMEHQKSVTLKASRVRQERQNGALSVQIVREKNQMDAEKIKHQRLKNEKMMAQRKMFEMEKNKQMVSNSHRNQEYSREKLKTLNHRKQSQAKASHDFKLLDQYIKGEMQKRKNTKLFNTLKSKVKRIEDESKKVNQELKEYEKLLGWNYSNRAGKKSGTSQSFYMTH